MYLTTTSNNSRYKAAIVLNNSAVTLLQRECYKDSVDTFRVAVSIIQTVIEDVKDPNSSGRTSLPTLVDEDINRYLQEAAHRCARASIVNDMHSGEWSDHSSKDDVVLVNISSQQDPSAVSDMILKASQGGTAKVFTCVVIEPTNHDDICLESIGLDCNSILYNFGVAHCLLACQIGSSLKTEQCLIDELRQSAFRLFRLIEPFFVSRLSWCPNEFHDRGVLLLCTLFAQTMSEVALHLQYTTICESYKTTLLAILVSISIQESLIPSAGCHASAA